MSARPTFGARSFLLSRVAYGEADLVVHLFTESLGKVSGLARGARRSQKRFAGSLEPLHTLVVELEEKAQGELLTLKGASIEKPRMGIVDSLDAMDAAGHALGWVRKASPQRTPEPLVFAALENLLDHLDRNPRPELRDAELIAFGLRLLDALGFGLELTRCVSCGKPCGDERSAWLSPERGGIVCRACGGGPLLLGAPLRSWMREVVRDPKPPSPEVPRGEAFRIVERAIDAHIAS